MWIQLVGEKGESGQIQIKPGYGPQDKFEKGRIYKVVARVADIGRVSRVGSLTWGKLYSMIWFSWDRVPGLFYFFMLHSNPHPHPLAYEEMQNYSTLHSLIQIVDVKVGQDLSSAPNKGLYVEEVVVTASRGDGVVFPCKCWTGDEEHVQQTEAEGPLGESLQCTLE